MSAGFHSPVNRPPPPTYTEALKYPVESSITHASRSTSKELPPFTKTELDFLPSWNVPPIADEPLYQTLPGEQVFLYQPCPVYSNILLEEDFFPKRFTYKITKTASGKPLIYLEAIPENLASSKEMGVKTYAQLEVVAAGSEREGELVYGRGAVTTSASGCLHKDVQTNGKAVLVPINGTITPDRMIVDALLNEHVAQNECCGGYGSDDDGRQVTECSLNGPNSLCETEKRLVRQQHQEEQQQQHYHRQHSPQNVHYSVMKRCDPGVRDIGQVEKDLETLNQALEDDERCPSLDEDTPLLHIENESAQSESRDDDAAVGTRRDSLRHEYSKTKSLVENESRLSDSRDVHVVVGECSCLNMADHHVTSFSDHVTDNSAEHVIYSEPEYSSSDASISKGGVSHGGGGGGSGCGAASDTPRRYTKMADTCQKTLKRTHNSVDHTVYELSPSDSFYSPADSAQVQGAEKDPSSSANTSDGSLCRSGHGTGSHAAGPASGAAPPSGTAAQKGQHVLNRDSSVSFKKPLVEGPSTNRPGCQDDTMATDGSATISADAEPLFTSANKSPSESNEAIAAQLILEDTRTYYRRKAADKGTLCCACVGVAVVATIVFLLIYFS